MVARQVGNQAGSQVTSFFRFPHTPHLDWLGEGSPRDDKVLASSEVRAMLAGEVVIEEKLDGANLGFSRSTAGKLLAQNRGQYLQPPFNGQFARLTSWLGLHEDRMEAGLAPNLIAFGEWCVARHSLEYIALPDWWLLFDVYDRDEGKFWSTSRRDKWANNLGLTTVACVTRGRFNLAGLKDLLDRSMSQYRNGPMEGIVVRLDQGDWLNTRAKLVRADFSQSIDTHWLKRAMQWNRLRISA